MCEYEVDECQRCEGVVGGVKRKKNNIYVCLHQSYSAGRSSFDSQCLEIIRGRGRGCCHGNRQSEGKEKFFPFISCIFLCLGNPWCTLARARGEDNVCSDTSKHTDGRTKCTPPLALLYTSSSVYIPRCGGGLGRVAYCIPEVLYHVHNGYNVLFFIFIPVTLSNFLDF